MKCCIIVAVAGLLAAAAQAETISIGASRDNTLYQSDTGALSNGAGSYLFAGTTGTSEIRRGLIGFDVAENIPAGSVITGVTLRLTMSRTITGGTPIGLHRVTANWDEGTARAPGEEGAGAAASSGDSTWLHRSFNTTLWDRPGGDFTDLASATISVSGDGVYEWTNTPGLIGDVQSWLNDPLNNFGWLLRANEATSRTAKRFNTREHPTESSRPALIVEYVVPSPGGATALLVAAAFSARRRRR